MGKAPQGSASAWPADGWPANGWRIVGRSVQGASHVRGGVPNQDAIQWFPDSGVGPPLILSLSDGHGSPRNFRSDVGARFAVEEATNLMRELLLAGQPDPSSSLTASLSTIKRTAEERLPEEVVRRWRAVVNRHLEAHPITQEEFETLEKRRDAKARRAIEKDPQVAYGATLLSVLITSGFILYMQLGDGDILTVADNGEVARPMTRDPRLMANETTSLCMHDAWREVQIKFQTLYGPHPALILLSTDGYANSFVNENAFLKVGSDILDILRTDGLEIVEQNLSDWLKDASQAGSGDDITMGIVFPVAILAAPAPEPSSVQPPKPRRKRAKPRTAVVPRTVTSSTAAPKVTSQPAPDEAQPSAAPVEAESPEETATPEKKLQKAAKEKAEAQGKSAVPHATAAEPEPASSAESVPEHAEAAPVAPPPDERPAEPPAKPRIELIKNEDRPREPSKKLPDIFYED